MWRIASETDPNGYTTRWEYDRLGRVTRVTHPNGGIETYTYNDIQNILTHRTIQGVIYTYRYDTFGNLQTITAPDGAVILTNIYDNRMRLIETRNAQGIASSQRTAFTYDIFDRVTEIRQLNAAGAVMHRQTITYHDILDTAGNSRIVTTTHGGSGAPNIDSFVQYDRFGRRTQEGTVGGRIVTYTHDLAGRVIREQSLGIDNTFTHSLFGITAVRNIEGNTSRMTYDSMGRMTSSSDFMDNVQRLTYDAQGRLIRHDIPFERIGNTTHYQTTHYVYDRNGNLTQARTQTNLPGQPEAWSITTNTFRHNHLTRTQTGNGPITEYTYDLAGNVLTKQAGGATTRFTYNNRGQLTQTTQHLGQQEIFTYDANGNLLTRTDANGTVFRNTYDNMGRLIRQEAVRNNVVQNHRAYTFYATGAVRTITNGTHTILKTHDAQGRLIIQEESWGIRKYYQYNLANNRTSFALWVNNHLYTSTIYAYDVAQRLSTVTTNSQRLSTYTYNANSRRTRTNLGNGVVTIYTHNLAGLVTNITNQHGTAILSNITNVYYLDGNTHRVTEVMGGVTRTVTYSYDTARRLTREHDTGAGGGTLTRDYLFDARGNRTRMTVTGAEAYTVNYTYDLNNRLLTEVRTGSNPRTTTFTYDNNGNQLTSATSGQPGQPNQTEMRTYNAFNQLTRVTRPGMTSTYTYRADGLRQSKIVNDVRTTHVWDGTHVVAEQNTRGGVINRYDRGAGWRIVRSERHGFFLHNARGDVIQRTNASGAVIHTYRYTAFGMELDLPQAPPEITITTRERVPFTLCNCMWQPIGGLELESGFDLQSDAEFDLLPGLGPELEILPPGCTVLTPLRDTTTVEVRTTPGTKHVLEFDFNGSMSAGYLRLNIASPSVIGHYYARMYPVSIFRQSVSVEFTSSNERVWVSFRRIIPGIGAFGYYLLDDDFRGHDIESHVTQTQEAQEQDISGHEVLRLFGFENVYLSNAVLYRYVERNVPDPDWVWEESDSPFRFSGLYRDGHTSTYLTPHRHFSPRLGRWTQPDPFWGIHNMMECNLAIRQSGNLFMYVLHNPVRWTDPTGLDLRISGSEDFRNQVMFYLRQLTDHQLYFQRIDADYWQVRIAGFASSDSLLPYGNALIKRVVASAHITTIRHGDRNQFGVDNVRRATLAHYGSGSRIYFNPAFDPLITTFDSAGLAVSTNRPAHIGLAHELIHADRAMRGVYSAVRRLETISLDVERARFSPARILGGPTRTVTHAFEREEFATIGIRHYTANCITENMIRREHGLPQRASHREL